MDDRTAQPSFSTGGISPMQSAVPKLVTAKELSAKIPYSTVHVWRLEQKGEFPVASTWAAIGLPGWKPKSLSGSPGNWPSVKRSS